MTRPYSHNMSKEVQKRRITIHCGISRYSRTATRRGSGLVSLNKSEGLTFSDLFIEKHIVARWTVLTLYRRSRAERNDTLLQ